MEVKICSSCKEIKKIDFFHKLKTGKLGYHSHCKLCRSNYSKNNKYQKPSKGLVVCQKCNQIKSLDNFYRNTASSNGLQSYCISCHKEKIYESESKLKGYINKILRRIENYKDLNITNKDIIEIYNKQNKKCFLTSELLTYYSGKQLTKNKYESKFNICINKIDNEKPYSKENIQLVGECLAKMKKNLTNDNFIHLCKLVSSKNQIIIN